MTDVQLQFISYYQPSDKIWGWFTRESDQPTGQARKQWAYAFWAVVGKTISIKRHRIYGWSQMQALEETKVANKYMKLSEAELLQRWPSFHDDMDQRLLFLSLSSGFDDR